MSIRETPDYFTEDNAVFTVIFDLDINVMVESRTVTSLSVLVSTIVGVKIFFDNIIGLWLPTLQKKTQVRELIENLYHVDANDSITTNKITTPPPKDYQNLSDYSKNFKKFKFSFMEGIKFINIHASPFPFEFCTFKN